MPATNQPTLYRSLISCNRGRMETDHEMKRTTVWGAILIVIFTIWVVCMMFGPALFGEQRPPSDPPVESRF